MSAGTLLSLFVLFSSIFTTTSEVTGGYENLRVSEFSFFPGAPTQAEREQGVSSNEAFEFIEIFNPGPNDLSLNGVELLQVIQDGVNNDAAVDLTGLGVIRAGKYITVARDRSAFELRYGTDANLIALYTGNLNNRWGEIITLAYNKEIIQQFKYVPSELPSSTNGRGASVVLKNTERLGKLSNQWRASVCANGRPGRKDPETLLGCFQDDEEQTTTATSPPTTTPEPTTMQDASTLEQDHNATNKDTSTVTVKPTTTSNPPTTEGPTTTEQESTAEDIFHYRNLRVSEVNFSPKMRTIEEATLVDTEERFEFIEFYNAGDTDIQLDGAHVFGGVSFTFLPNTILRAGDYGLLVRNRRFFRVRYGDEPLEKFLGFWDNRDQLNNNHDNIYVSTPDGSLLISIEYEVVAPWPALPVGHTLTRKNLASRSNKAGAWRASKCELGSPGAAEPLDTSACFASTTAAPTTTTTIEPSTTAEPTTTEVPTTAEPVTTTAPFECPFSCFCTEETLTASCSILDPDYFFNVEAPKLASRTQTLLLRNNNLRHLPARAFSRFTLLQNLDLSGNQLEWLDEDSFRDIKDLKRLNLAGNMLDSMSFRGRVFAHLRDSLHTLDLSGNKIETLKQSMLAGLGSLRVLDLSNNQIAAGEAQAFVDVFNLQSLDLSSNLMEAVDALDFNGLLFVGSLHLGNNQIRNVTRSSMASLQFVQRLILRNNMITVLEDEVFAGKAIKFLDLSNNKLAIIQPDVYSGLNLLQGLSLAGNQLSEASGFDTMTNLAVLQLSDNDIFSIPVGAFPSEPFHLIMENNPSRCQFASENQTSSSPRLRCTCGFRYAGIRSCSAREGTLTTSSTTSSTTTTASTTTVSTTSTTAVTTPTSTTSAENATTSTLLPTTSSTTTTTSEADPTSTSSNVPKRTTPSTTTSTTSEFTSTSTGKTETITTTSISAKTIHTNTSATTTSTVMDTTTSAGTTSTVADPTASPTTTSSSATSTTTTIPPSSTTTSTTVPETTITTSTTIPATSTTTTSMNPTTTTAARTTTSTSTTSATTKKSVDLSCPNNPQQVLVNGECYRPFKCKRGTAKISKQVRIDCVCNEHCAVCKVSPQGYQCLTCGSRAYLHNDACVTNCPAGMSEFGRGNEGRSCQPQHICKGSKASVSLINGEKSCTCEVRKGCFECSWGEARDINCLACDTDLFLQGGNCVSQCKSSETALITTNARRQECRAEPFTCVNGVDDQQEKDCTCGIDDCYTCTVTKAGPTCTVCKNKAHLHQGTCVADCASVGRINSGSGKIGRECADE
eukprot:m.188010 g.188010  ORF g.188010 m.188010 type:complete len:1291 (-) comp25632_c0_seq2:41-3913(-)